MVKSTDRHPLAPTSNPHDGYETTRYELRKLLDRFSNFIYENDTVFATITLDQIIDDWAVAAHNTKIKKA